MKASELVAKLQSAIWENGDHDLVGWYETDKQVNGVDFSEEMEMEVDLVSFSKKHKCFYLGLEESK